MILSFLGSIVKVDSMIRKLFSSKVFAQVVFCYHWLIVKLGDDGSSVSNEIIMFWGSCSKRNQIKDRKVLRCEKLKKKTNKVWLSN